MIPNKLPQIYFCVKYDNNETVKWYKSKKNRSANKLMSYFRSIPAFKWAKVYNAKTKNQIFWFNKTNQGVTDCRTSDKKQYN